MNQLDVVDLSQILSTWWPLIIIVIGLIQLFNRTNSSKGSGFLFLLVGIVFLVNQWFDLNLFTYLWPLIFIFIGLFTILSRTKHEKTTYTDDKLNTFVLFSGAEIKNRSRNFQGGTVTTIFGGAEIDLREATIENGSIIDITSLFGGVSIIVPQHVRVEISGAPIFGGWEDNTRIVGENNDEVVLIFKCLTMFGGAEIRN